MGTSARQLDRATGSGSRGFAGGSASDSREMNRSALVEPSDNGITLQNRRTLLTAERTLLQERLMSIVRRFSQRQILVVGDSVADQFVYGAISRVSREA